MAEILVDPLDAPLDERLDIRFTDLPPNGEVTARMSTDDSFGRCMSSHGVFRADERGVVDLTRHAPVEGTYSGVDPMGLVWSMAPDGRFTPSDQTAVLPPMSMTLTVDVDGTGVAKTVLDRRRLPEGIERTEVRERGLVGTLFQPSEGGPHPGVLLLGGSEGGLHELDAALLARHGFTVLALAYFGAQGVPKHLVDIPLEYFGTALEFLRERTTAVGVLGGSRGGEAALLLGAMFPEVRAVVSVAGSGVVTQCIAAGANLLQVLEVEGASWTHEGEPLPYLPYSAPDQLRHRVVTGQPVPLGLAFDLTDGVPDDTVIPVERIQGGILLISAGQDAMWPCSELTEIAERRLDAHDHPFPYEHVHYPEAGHLMMGPPYRPTTDVVVPGPGVMFFTGGTPAANAAAQADAWGRIVEFFSARLAT